MKLYRQCPNWMVILCLNWGLTAVIADAAEWSIPIAGNVFRTAPAPGGDGLRRRDSLAWSNSEEVYSVFFRVDRPASVGLSVMARAVDGRATLTTHAVGREFPWTLETEELTRHELGTIEVTEPGYVRVEFRGESRSGASFGAIRDLVVSSDTPDLVVDFVRTNEGNMFYWGRRGPSVHLRYEVPQDRPLQYAYSEITVPTGQDPIGSYYMANGFGEGYFGIQVNSPEERRVLFSVWSPFQTNNPRDIPADQRIELLARGPGVSAGEFGNEGSGGQSYLVYPWKAATTYRFLTEVTPDGAGNTTYTSWFGDKAADEWRLIASFRRPKTDTHLRGFHSFLESFSPTHGYLGRRADYGNVWVRDIDGTWHECTQASFSVDPTGRGRHRLDFGGGAEGDHFYLRNCGFFSPSGTPGQQFVRESSANSQPDIKFDQLPRSSE